MIESQRAYSAFISYKNNQRDREIAAWLQSKLETFRIDRSLRQKLGLDRSRLDPVFRDSNEMVSAGDLGQQIEDGLGRSKTLIVISSKESLDSEWVRREVDYFRSLRPARTIIPVIAPGQGEDVARQAGRLGSVEDPVLAADLRPKSGESAGVARRRALVQVLAGMLGVEFTELESRERKRNLARRRILTAVIILVAAISAGIWSSLHSERQRRIHSDEAAARAEYKGSSDRGWLALAEGDWQGAIGAARELDEWNPTERSGRILAEVLWRQREGVLADIVMGENRVASSILVSPDGVVLAHFALGGTTFRWSPLSGEAPVRYDETGAPGATGGTLVLMPGGESYLSGTSDPKIRRVADASLVLDLGLGPESLFTPVAVSPNGAFVAGGGILGIPMRVMSVGADAQTLGLVPQDDVVYARFSPNSEQLLTLGWDKDSTGKNSNVKLCSISPTGVALRSVLPFADSVVYADWFPNGESFYVVGPGGGVRVLNSSGEQRLQLDLVNQVAVSAHPLGDDRIAIGYESGQIAVFDLDTGLLRSSSAVHAGEARYLATDSSASLLISAGLDERLVFSDPATLALQEEIALVGTPFGMAMDPRDRFLVISAGHRLTAIGLPGRDRTDRLSNSRPTQIRGPRGVSAFAKAGELLLIDDESGALRGRVQPLAFQGLGVDAALSLSDDLGRICLAGPRGELVIRNVSNGLLIKTLPVFAPGGTRMFHVDPVFIPDNQLVAGCDDNSLHVVDLQGQGNHRVVAFHDTSVSGVVRVADNRVLSISRDGTCALWDSAFDRPIHSLKIPVLDHVSDVMPLRGRCCAAISTGSGKLLLLSVSADALNLAGEFLIPNADAVRALGGERILVTHESQLSCIDLKASQAWRFQGASLGTGLSPASVDLTTGLITTLDDKGELELWDLVERTYLGPIPSTAVLGSTLPSRPLERVGTLGVSYQEGLLENRPIPGAGDPSLDPFARLDELTQGMSAAVTLGIQGDYGGARALYLEYQERLNERMAEHPRNLVLQRMALAHRKTMAELDERESGTFDPDLHQALLVDLEALLGQPGLEERDRWIVTGLIISTALPLEEFDRVQELLPGVSGPPPGLGLRSILDTVLQPILGDLHIHDLAGRGAIMENHLAFAKRRLRHDAVVFGSGIDDLSASVVEMVSLKHADGDPSSAGAWKRTFDRLEDADYFALPTNFLRREYMLVLVGVSNQLDALGSQELTVAIGKRVQSLAKGFHDRLRQEPPLCSMHLVNAGSTVIAKLGERNCELTLSLLELCQPVAAFLPETFEPQLSTMAAAVFFQRATQAFIICGPRWAAAAKASQAGLAALDTLAATGGSGAEAIRMRLLFNCNLANLHMLAGLAGERIDYVDEAFRMADLLESGVPLMESELALLSILSVYACQDLSKAEQHDAVVRYGELGLDYSQRLLGVNPGHVNGRAAEASLKAAVRQARAR